MNNATHRYDPLDAACDVLYFGSIITIVLGTIVLDSTFALAPSEQYSDAGQVILCGAVATLTCLVVTAVIAWALSAKDAKQMAKQKRE